MKHLLPVLLLLISTPALGADMPDLDALREEVRSTEAAFAATMAARDHDAFSSFLSEEAVFNSPAGALRGRAEVAEGWLRFFEGPDAPFSWVPDQVEVLESGNLALSTGPVLDPEGKRVGSFVSTWRREADGVWKIVLDTGCSCPEQ